MALAKKCDMCGKFYDDKVGKQINGFTFLRIDKGRRTYTVSDILDCCPECLESIKEHIRKLKGERNESSKSEE